LVGFPGFLTFVLRCNKKNERTFYFLEGGPSQGRSVKPVQSSITSP
jgi:hypothetical protein